MKTVIGLEIHLQLKTQSKLFCSCPTEGYREASPNSLVCPTCVSQPGSKPFGVNAATITQALKIALALGSKITDAKVLVQRKHYFYPDLASGFQRTSKPIATGGALCGVRIREMHIEEDPGQYDLRKGTVNYNRSGIPLIEIVTEPDMDSPDQARQFLDELKAVLDYLDASRVEPGSMRCDANISISMDGKEGTRTEIKNINSFKGVYTALSFEGARQRSMLKNKLKIEQETRHYDEAQGITTLLRKKESADDYRYFPDPDVPPIEISQTEVVQLKKRMPELPSQKRERFRKDYGITEEEAFTITLEKPLADAFEETTKKVPAANAARFFRGTLKKQLNYRSLDYKDSSLSPTTIIELLSLLEEKQITEKVSEQLLIGLLDKGLTPKENAQKQGLLGVHGGKEIEALVEKAIADNTNAVTDYKNGKPEALHFLAGQVMKQSKGKADPAIVKKLLEKKLAKE